MPALQVSRQSSPAVLDAAAGFLPTPQQLLGSLYKMRGFALPAASQPVFGTATAAQLDSLWEAVAPLLPKLLLLLTAMLWAR
jgi:hypothetical protein